MEAFPPAQPTKIDSLRCTIAHFEALGLDWGTAVIATAQRHRVRLMDVIVAAPRVEEGSVVRS
jgi:hypothetical protein